MSAAAYRSVMSTLRICQKPRLVLKLPDVESHVSEKIQVYIFNPVPNRHLFTHGKPLYWRYSDFVPCIRRLIIIQLKKVPF